MARSMGKYIKETDIHEGAPEHLYNKADFRIGKSTGLLKEL